MRVEMTFQVVSYDYYGNAKKMENAKIWPAKYVTPNEQTYKAINWIGPYKQISVL